MDDQRNQEAIHPAGRVRGSEERCSDQQYDQSDDQNYVYGHFYDDA